MNILTARKNLEQQLTPLYQHREASLIAKYYFEDKNYYDSHHELNEEELSMFNEDVQRFLANEPLQYITNICHFYGRKFKVNQHTLIPRPETEELVYQVLSTLKSSHLTNRMLEIGSGSGCIPITIDLETHKKHDILSIDISDGALEIARQNAKKMHSHTLFEKVDFLDEKQWSKLQTFAPDIIVSNPPYISEEERKDMLANVLKYEPEIALFSDPDPLLFYRKIAKFGQSLKKNIFIYCEINEHLSRATENVFINAHYQNIEILKDLQGKDRMIKAALLGLNPE